MINKLMELVTFNIPYSEDYFKYYSNRAYYDEYGWYMLDDEQKKHYVDEKYLSFGDNNEVLNTVMDNARKLGIHMINRLDSFDTDDYINGVFFYSTDWSNTEFIEKFAEFMIIYNEKAWVRCIQEVKAK